MERHGRRRIPGTVDVYLVIDEMNVLRGKWIGESTAFGVYLDRASLGVGPGTVRTTRSKTVPRQGKQNKI